MCPLGHGPIHPVLGVFTIIRWGPQQTGAQHVPLDAKALTYLTCDAAK